MSTTYTLHRTNESFLLRWDTTETDAGTLTGATIALPHDDVTALLAGTVDPEAFAFDAEPDDLPALAEDVTRWDSPWRCVTSWEDGAD